MKILYTSTAYPPSTGGGQFYLHQLRIHLHPRHSVQVLTFWNKNCSDWLLGTTIKAPREQDDYVYENIPVHTLGFPVKKKHICFLTWLLIIL